jgi:hypothetical protein
MIRDFCFNSCEPSYESKDSFSPAHVLCGDLDGDGEQETILGAVNGDYVVVKVGFRYASQMLV